MKKMCGLFIMIITLFSSAFAAEEIVMTQEYIKLEYDRFTKILDVAYNGDVYVVCGKNAFLAVSEDLITWTPISISNNYIIETNFCII